jgi:hypothetical protein
VCVCVLARPRQQLYSREEGQSLIAAWEGKDGGTAILAYRKGKQKKVRHSWREDICASIYLSVSPLTGALMCVFLTVNKEGDAKRTGVDILSPKIHTGVQKGRPSTAVSIHIASERPLRTTLGLTMQDMKGREKRQLHGA